MNCKISPIIIYGMHRSGTTLISKVLEAQGLFVGHQKDANHEAQFFLQLNDWLMLQSGGAWDQPIPTLRMLQDEQMRAALREYMLNLLRSTRVASYLGLYRYLRVGRVSGLATPWGWKDPRNTFLLPLWSEIFPDAKYVNVTRHGCDVAGSLKTRSDRLKLELPDYLKRRYPKFVPLPPRRRPVVREVSARLNTYASAFSLWEEYMEQASKLEAQHAGRTFSLRYEDFLERPLELLPELASFAGLTSSAAQNKTIAASVRSSRAYAYRNSDDLVRLAQEKKAALSRFGY